MTSNLPIPSLALRSEFGGIYFDYFNRTDNPDDQAHVAQILLDQLMEQPEWVLPYLPKVGMVTVCR